MQLFEVVYWKLGAFVEAIFIKRLLVTIYCHRLFNLREAVLFDRQDTEKNTSGL